jgi:hypothetical protein
MSLLGYLSYKSNKLEEFGGEGVGVRKDELL